MKPTDYIFLGAMAALALFGLGLQVAALRARRARRFNWRLNFSIHDIRRERYACTVWGRLSVAHEVDLDSVDEVPHLAVGEEFTVGRYRVVRNPDRDRPSIGGWE